MKHNLCRYTALILAVIFIVLTFTACKTRAYEDVPKPVSVAEAVAKAEAEAEAERKAAEEAERAAREAEEEAKKVQKSEGTAAVGNVDILYGRMNRGSEVSVVSDADTPASFYTILLEDGDRAMIDRNLVRLESEKQFAEYTAAAKEQIDIYNSAYLDRSVIAVIEPEAEFSVIDEFGDVRAVKYGDHEGYIAASAGIERKSGEADTGEKAEVSLPEEGSVKGTVLTDFAEMYMGKLSRGDKVEITDMDDSTVSIIDDEDNTGIVPRWAVSVEGDTPYTGWSAFTLEDFSAYSNYMMIGKASVFDAGTPISIIGRTETGLIIEMEGGAVFFADDDGFYKKISMTEPEPEEEVKEEEDKEAESEKDKKEESSDKKKDSDSDKKSDSKKDTDTKKDSSSDKKKEESSDKDKETKPSEKETKPDNKEEEQSSGGSEEDNYPDAVKGKVKYTANCKVTAYCSYCDPSGVGSSGATLAYGSIAADKSIFPYGTKIYIPGYGTGTVVDTGVSGYTLDVYLGEQPDDSACRSWGRKNLTVYILK